MSSLKLQKLRISVKAYESNILDSACVKIVDAVKASGIEPVGPVPLPTKLRRYCVLTSPHVNKKARDHFEIRTHKRIIDVYKPNNETMENLRNLDLSAGVDVEIKSI
jgi:small subunit ribosomal protein S10